MPLANHTRLHITHSGPAGAHIHVPKGVEHSIGISVSYTVGAGTFHSPSYNGYRDSHSDARTSNLTSPHHTIDANATFPPTGPVAPAPTLPMSSPQNAVTPQYDQKCDSYLESEVTVTDNIRDLCLERPEMSILHLDMQFHCLLPLSLV